jgi:hypothetical protein
MKLSRRLLSGCPMLLLVASACSLSVPRVGEEGASVPSSAEETKYQGTLERYTDHAEVYDLLNTRMFTALTYQSWPFREARVHRMALFQVQPQPIVEKNLAAERAAFESFHEFFFGVHLNNSRYDDFDRRNSIWRIALLTDAGETTPSSVERVGRSDLNMRAIYPYMDEFWVAYRLRFPRQLPAGDPVIPPGTKRLTVRIASTLGKAELHFPAE